jgi:hypothetical protein
MSHGSAGLMVDRRFWPLFWTQFTVAFNDNVFKNGLVLMVTYSERLFGTELKVLGLDANVLNPVTNLLLIVPFVLFSAIAGQLSDRYPKHLVMQAAKFAEIPIMAAAAVGFVLAALGDPYSGALVLLGLVFFMGLQSALFGPSKYAILPQLLPDQGDLVAGNALIEMGTYLSVLGGIALATGLIELPGGLWWFAVAVVLIAVIGWVVSRQVPAVPAQSPDLRVAWEPVTSTWDAARVLFKDTPVLQSVLGISWFWALGGAILVLFATWAKDVLHGEPAVYATFMGLFAVGIGAGSIACERLSFGRLEMGLVPFGSAGLFLGLLALFLIGEPWPAPADGALLGLLDLVVYPMFWVLVVVVLVLAASGGFFMVPLYTLVQDRSEPSERSRVIGANNIVNSFFILLLQGALLGFAALNLSEPVVFGLLGAINVGVALYIYLQVPEFTLRFITWILSNVLYRVRVAGLERVPEKGPCLVVCNHVSFVDFLILMGALRRPARFVMDRKMSQIPVLSILFRQAKVIPITSFKEDPALVQRAFDTVHEELARGRIVVIFPEGGLTWDGKMIPFKAGVERILARDAVPVVPMALNGLWGGFFSRKSGRAMTRPFPRGVHNPVWLTIGQPVPGDRATAATLQDAVTELWSARPDHP